MATRSLPSNGSAVIGLLLALALSGCVAPEAVVNDAASDLPGLLLPGEPSGAIPLTGDRPVFWAGGPMRPVRLPTPNGEYDTAVCDRTLRGTCPEYALDVTSGGARLRVAIDHPTSADFFGLELRDARGKVLDYASGGQSNELFLDAPPAGRYFVRVIPWEVPAPSNPPFALRAKLESAAVEPTPDGLLLPNLRVDPPAEFTFLQPPPLYLNLVPLPIRQQASCLPDEMIEEGARRCLRFSFGYRNVGEGPMDLHFSPLTDALATAAVVQRMHRADGSFEEQAAGTYTYHKTHMHYHYDDIFSAKLFRVTDEATGALEPAGDLAKRGACAHDIRIGDWMRFDQAPRGSEDSGNDCSSFYAESPLAGMRIGLSTGWSDIYPWFMPSNYVEFSGQPDGFYVVRVTADIHGRLAETDETDNVGYSYVEIRGNEIQVMERGRGQDPWDPARVVDPWPRHLAVTPE